MHNGHFPFQTHSVLKLWQLLNYFELVSPDWLTPSTVTVVFSTDTLVTFNKHKHTLFTVHTIYVLSPNNRSTTPQVIDQNSICHYTSSNTTHKQCLYRFFKLKYTAHQLIPIRKYDDDDGPTHSRSQRSIPFIPITESPVVASIPHHVCCIPFSLTVAKHTFFVCPPRRPDRFDRIAGQYRLIPVTECRA